ncbi:M61 family metallopeptidase [Massilia endophytica]|uniref:M61 family metallopeptidase n=1 Tax=Massilia endophytica TaxID=2899220 RepID=UPI001E505D5F|nr:M61 family metallopeptidase [Massilia endophytica]UGQ46963.1 M61 family metallopeptidase [Massilia endophytica]
MKKTNKTIAYTIAARDLAAHLFEVSVTVAAPAAEGQVFALPAWIPGSYMIREFSRNIVRIRAEAGGQAVELTKLDKHSWQAAPVKGPLTVHYEVYAWDLSVRAAHLDQTHGFFNGTSVFLRVAGQEDVQHVVDIQRPADELARNWRVATALPELKAKRYGFGTYAAASYDELIDSPVEMGDFALATFKAHGVPHDIVITGRVPNLDMARLAADLKTICETQIAFFEPKTRKAPMDRYVFMTLAVGDGYGGLEHRASTALICARADLPSLAAPAKERSEGYIRFLGLCSHEYFHTWNVKRIKPSAFAPYDLQVENYTPLLWLFEGFTSYYDDLFLVRSGMIDEATYYKMVAKGIGGVLRNAGRTKQSVADSSFDAWGKYYRQDENAPNAIVSYYAKGSLIGMGLDLSIRAKSAGRRSLDDIMLALWQRYGRDFHTNGRGITPAEVESLFDEVSGMKLRPFFEKYIRGTEDVPLAKLLAPFGVKYSDERKPGKPSLDVNLGRDGADCKLSSVHEGGAAHRAGLSAGDLLVAIDGLRVTGNPANVDTLLARYSVGDTVEVHAFRRDELMCFKATLQGDRVPGIKLTLDPARKSGALPRPTTIR